MAGVSTRCGLMQALTWQSPTTPGGAVMQRESPVVEAGEMLETLFARLQECQCPCVPVTCSGVSVVWVTSDNTGAFLMIEAALKGRASSVVPPALPQAGA